MNIEISFSEAGVDSIDSTTDKFRRRLCRTAEQLARNEGLTVVASRHIIKANNQLVAAAGQQNEQSMPSGRSDSCDVDKPTSLSRPQTDNEWQALNDAIGQLSHARTSIETLTLQETRE